MAAVDLSSSESDVPDYRGCDRREDAMDSGDQEQVERMSPHCSSAAYRFTPKVPISELSTGSLVCIARRVYDLVDGEKEAKINAALESKWQALLGNLHCQPDAAMREQIYNRFLLEEYALIVRDVVDADIHTTNFVFNPLLPVSRLSEDVQTKAASLISRVCEHHVDRIHDRVESKIREAMNDVPAYLREQVGDAVQERILLDFYYGIVEDVLVGISEPAVEFVFQPRLLVSQIRDDIKATAPALISRVKECHVPLIQESIERKITDAIADIPAYLQSTLSTAVTNNVLQTSYYQSIFEVLSHDAGVSVSSVLHASEGFSSETNPFIFEPLIPVAQLPNVEDQAMALTLIPQVESHHVALIDAACAAMVKDAFSRMPKHSMSGVENRIQQNILLAKYWEVVAQVVGQNPACRALNSERSCESNLGDLASGDLTRAYTHPSSIPAVSSERSNVGCRALDSVPPPESNRVDLANGEVIRRNEHLVSVPAKTSKGNDVDNASFDVGDAVFVSPQKRRRSTADNIPTDVMQTVSVSEIQKLKISSSDAFSFQGHLLYCPDEPRTVQSFNKKTKEFEEALVLTVLLADRTGPAQLDIWRDDVRPAIRQFQEYLLDDQQSVILNINRVLIRDADRKNEKCYPSIRKLVLTSKSAVTRVDQPATQSLVDRAVKLDSDSYCVDFSKLPSSPSFIVNVCGVLSECGNSTPSSDGTPMLNCRLHDLSGRWFECVFHGRQCGNPAVCDGNEVIIYYMHAKEGLGAAGGKLWAYSDAHVVMSRKSCATPSSRLHLELR